MRLQGLVNQLPRWYSLISRWDVRDGLRLSWRLCLAPTVQDRHSSRRDQAVRD